MYYYTYCYLYLLQKMPFEKDPSHYEYIDNKYDGYSKSEYDELKYERKYNKEYDGDIKSKHVPSKYDEDFDKEYAEDLKYEEYEKNKKKNENEETDVNEENDVNYDSDNSNCDSDDETTNKYTSYKFKTYQELIELTNQEDTPDKINNIVTALIKAITIKKCKETSFNFDFSLGIYATWVATAKLFNKNNVGVDYRMLIDEDSIVCYLVNDELIE